MAVCEVTLVPIGTEKTSCSSYVARAYDSLKNLEGINIQLNPMGTVLEGDIDALFKAVRIMQEAVFEGGVARVYTVLKIDDRRDKTASTSQKIESVMRKLKD